MSQRMALEASHLISRRVLVHLVSSQKFNSAYSPIPVMEMHGFLDEIAQYSNSGRLSLFEEDARTKELYRT